MPIIEYRRALPQDYLAIVRLNEANFIGNLAEDDRRDGFLSAVFTLEQTAAMAEDLGTTVAIVDGALAGFLCAFRKDFPHGSPVVARMIESYRRMRFEGKPLSRFNSYVYGPVCIDRAFRRRGLLRGLYEAQKKELAGQFEVGVALVSRDNPHSRTSRGSA
jgi:ribosomal protein S18 acetylase RimI-like enzyme